MRAHGRDTEREHRHKRHGREQDGSEDDVGEDGEGGGWGGRLRSMSSGERQYRNGCRRGDIADECARFSVGNLLRRGIDPFR